MRPKARICLTECSGWAWFLARLWVVSRRNEALAADSKREKGGWLGGWVGGWVGDGPVGTMETWRKQQFL